MAEAHPTSRRGLPRSYRLPAVGERHGQALIVADAEDLINPDGTRIRFVQARCDCGNVFEASLRGFRKGDRVTCGAAIHHGALTHGSTGTPTYKAWCAIFVRVRGYSDERNIRNYVDRGITIAPRWCGPNGFANFLTDMGEKPRGLTLDRIDNDGIYEPGNCRWALKRVQDRNKRTNVWIEYGGERMVLEDACNDAGISKSGVSHRAHQHGISHQVAFDCYAFAEADVVSLHLFWYGQAWLRSRPWPKGVAHAAVLF